MKHFSHSTAILLAVSSLPSSHGAAFDSANTISKGVIRRQSNPLNPFLSIITNLPPINLLVDGTAGGLTDLEGLLAPVVGGSTNATDLEAAKPCADLTMVFARGTTEPGNMGVFVGPEFVQAVQKTMAGMTMNVQGVIYAASIQGYLEGGGADGTTSMSQFMTQAATSCPNTKIIMSGYSQGGQVVHNTAKALPASVMERVSAVVIFGDPQSQTPVQNAETKTMVICHNGDNICSNGDLILPAHLTYAFDTAQAAAYVSKMVTGSSSAGARM